MEVVAVSSPLLKSFLAGIFSGSCSTFLFQPLDLVKTRLQSSGKARICLDDALTIITNVYKKDAFLGFWKGTTPSLLRCAPGVGVYFGTLHWLTTNLTNGKPHPMEAMCLGGFARTISGITILPFTVIKTRFESDIYKYQGVYHALCKIYSTEGIRGLYSGLLPTLIRDVPFSSIYLLFYTEGKNLLGLTSDKKMSPHLYFMCATMSGICASFLTHPADVIKTQMQLRPNSMELGKVAIHIYKVSGIRGYFIGLCPRILRRTLVTALAWTVYEHVCDANCWVETDVLRDSRFWTIYKVPNLICLNPIYQRKLTFLQKCKEACVLNPGK